jgi:hypothetical protein
VPRGRFARRRRGHLRARAERAGVHLPAAGRVHHQRAGRLHRGRLAGPVFVQGDHYQFNAKKYAADPEATTEGLRRLTREALAVGYGNIDIDSARRWSTCRSADGRRAAAHVNYQRAAELSALIRQRAGGHDRQHRRRDRRGGQAELDRGGAARLPRRLPSRELDALAGSDAAGLSKVSVQTGTSHGGVPLPGGGVAEVKLDFDTLERLSAVCREYGMAGAVQHGASTLPDELFHRFPQVETAEIHLATGFQNLLYEHPAFPADLRARSRAGASPTPPTSARRARPTTFLYKTRKKALGPYKRQLWELPTRTRSSPTRRPSSASCSSSWASPARRRWSRATSSSENRAQPLPEACAGCRGTGSG